MFARVRLTELGVVALVLANVVAPGQLRAERDASQAIAQVFREQKALHPPRPVRETAMAVTTRAPIADQSPPDSAAATCSGVQVAAGANLATLAAESLNNTTFCLAPGTYVVNPSIAAKDGQDWIGAVGLNGELLSTLTGNDNTQYAFATTAPNVSLRNIIVERFENPVQKSTLQGLAPSRRFWLVDNVEVRFNKGIGLSVNGGSIVRNSYVHHNEQMGLAGFCGGGTDQNCLFENNEVSYNNYLGQNDPNWEAGGSKFVGTEGHIVRGNSFHHNCGPAIWYDGNNSSAIIENNAVSSNAGEGILYEINDPSSAIIRNNLVTDNAHGTLGSDGPVCRTGYGGGIGGIVISSSENVEVHGNTLIGNDGGITGFHNVRAVGPCPPTGCLLSGLWVHDNDVTYTVGWTGIRDFTSDNASYETAANNRFARNTYSFGTLPQPFYWVDSPRTRTQWQRYGHDLQGSFG